MKKEKILAYMYDFYNNKTLKGQNDDISYYINKIEKYNPKNILVIGAGTGRIAIPLSNYAKVVALDFDKYRLEILNEKEKSIRTICSDFSEIIIKEKFDMIIIPYSTLQFLSNKNKLNIIFNKIHDIMNEKSILLFDVSEGFNTKDNVQEKEITNDYCAKVDDYVKILYSAKKYENYIEFNVNYVLTKSKINLLEHEKYFFYDFDLLNNVIKNANLILNTVDNGYGVKGFKHKHIFNCTLKVEK